MPTFLSTSLLVLTGVWLAGTITVYGWAIVHPSCELENNKKRANTWGLVLLFFALIFLLPRGYTYGLFFVLTLTGLWEIVRVSRNKPLSFFSCYTAVLFVTAMGCAICGLSRAKGLFFIGIILTQLNDIGQYCWGKALGKHPLIASVSPAKTWEGFLGGCATTAVLGALFIPSFTPLNSLKSALLGLFLAVGGALGDITLSYFKRLYGQKDMGTLLPGHGGLLDRLDSTLYNLPLLLLITLL